MNKYEIPTHLHVEDKLLGGLTVRQVLYVSVGLSLGYALWQHLQLLTHVGPAGVVLRVAICALPVVALLLCGFTHPTGRPLEEWVLAALRYAALPKVAVWRSATSGELDDTSDDPSALPDAASVASAIGALHESTDESHRARADNQDAGDLHSAVGVILPAADHRSSSATWLRFRFPVAVPERTTSPMQHVSRFAVPGEQPDLSEPARSAGKNHEKGQS